MTLFELLDQLESWRETYGDDLEVVMSKDAEGNNYSPVATTNSFFYLADTTWSGDIYDEDEMDEYDMLEADRERAVRAVVLWPIN